VRLELQDGSLIVQVVDQGMSFDPQVVLTTGKTSGLAGMRERTHLLGGRLLVESSPGVGTLVRGELPLEPCIGRLATVSTDDRHRIEEC
jgi:signal transduction histidine kinase